MLRLARSLGALAVGLAAPLPATAQAGCLPPPSDLVAWWPGEGTPDDLVGNHPGNLTGDAGYAPGRVGHSFRVSGAGSVAMPDSSLWAFGSNPFTIAVWVRFDAITPRAPFFGYNDGAGLHSKWIFWYDTSGHTTPPGPALRFHINSPSIGPQDPAYFPWSPTTAVWYHVAITRSGTSYTQFIDGAAVSTSTDANAVPDATGPLTMGLSEGLAFVGRLDEAMLFARALSASEIAAIHSAGSAGLCKPAAIPALPGVAAGALFGVLAAWASYRWPRARRAA